MFIHYSKDVDTLYIRLKDEKVADTDQLDENIIIDYDEDGKVIAIKILNASEKTNITRMIIEHLPNVTVKTT